MATKFKKEKLSRTALDELAKRNAVSDKSSFPYTLATGNRIAVSTYKILTRFWKV